MQHIIRFTFSGFLGFFITAALFIGMLNLLGRKPQLLNTDSVDLSISYVKAEIDAKEKKRQRKKPPEPQKASQPPSAPKLNIEQNKQAELNVPVDYSQGKNLNFVSKTSVPGFKFHVGGIDSGAQGGVKAGIPPIYPPKALLKNIEGWVKVIIDINEVGTVTKVTVVDAEPARLFEEAALKAVRKWSFYQKKEYGKAVPYQMIQTIEFKIDEIVEE